jgi:NADH-quinone oxidoreductase subunit A
MLNYSNNFLKYFHFIEFNNFKNSLLGEEYLSIFLIIIIASILASVIFIFSYILAIQNPESEKLSSYECGFEPYEDARLQFDVKFYLIAILFIVFDIEAMFLYPWCVSISQLNITGFWSMIDFIIELGVGYIYIWFIGALNWD